MFDRRLGCLSPLIFARRPWVYKVSIWSVDIRPSRILLSGLDDDTRRLTRMRGTIRRCLKEQFETSYYSLNYFLKQSVIFAKKKKWTTKRNSSRQPQNRRPWCRSKAGKKPPTPPIWDRKVALEPGCFCQNFSCIRKSLIFESPKCLFWSKEGGLFAKRGRVAFCPVWGYTLVGKPPPQSQTQVRTWAHLSYIFSFEEGMATRLSQVTPSRGDRTHRSVDFQSADSESSKLRLQRKWIAGVESFYLAYSEVLNSSGVTSYCSLKIANKTRQKKNSCSLFLDNR